MQLELRMVNTHMAEVLRGYVGRRLRFVLRLFGDRLGYITVAIARKSRTELSCRISAQRLPFGFVHILRAIPICSRPSIVQPAESGGVGRELERLREARNSRESVRLVA